MELTVFNILGQRVTELVGHELSAGTHTVEWNSRDSDGNEMPSGVYLYRLRSGDATQTRKMILLR